MDVTELVIGAAVSGIVGGAVQAFPQVVDAARAHNQREERVRRAKHLLGLDPLPESVAGFRSDSVHPLYRDGALHPDNGDALVSVARSAIYHAAELGQLDTREEVRISLQQDVLLFGSPASEGLSRLIFGYRARPGRDDLKHEQVPIDLPFRWELDRDALVGRHAARHVRGRGGDPTFRPPWCIVSTRPSGVTVYRPELRTDPPFEDFLKEDYLLVTRIPNFLTDAWADGRFIVSFGGAHGVATRAVRLLLRNEPVLLDIADALGVDDTGSGGARRRYQLVLRVGGIEHDPGKGSYATSIELVDSAVLDQGDSVWDDAQRAVRPALASWIPQPAGT